MENITNIYYINLIERCDRKNQVEEQLSKIGIKSAKRFEAIKQKNGRVGCSLSHLALLKLAKKQNWDHIMIVEDDIFFLNPKLFVEQLNKFLLLHSKDADVVLLCGNNLPPYDKIDDCCIKVSYCQTTTGYIVYNHYFDILIENIKEGILNLIKEPELHRYYAIDKFWISLQSIGNWYLIIPPTVIQKPDYSDIEKKITDFTAMYLDLDKPWLFRGYSH